MEGKLFRLFTGGIALVLYIGLPAVAQSPRTVRSGGVSFVRPGASFAVNSNTYRVGYPGRYGYSYYRYNFRGPKFVRPGLSFRYSRYYGYPSVRFGYSRFYGYPSYRFPSYSFGYSRFYSYPRFYSYYYPRSFSSLRFYYSSPRFYGYSRYYFQPCANDVAPLYDACSEALISTLALSLRELPGLDIPNAVPTPTTPINPAAPSLPAPQAEEPAPSYRYDGGPVDPVPQPAPQTAPAATPSNVRNVALTSPSKPTRYRYRAYGEK